jgi:hypothetical protein
LPRSLENIEVHVRKLPAAYCLAVAAALVLCCSKGSAAHRISMLRGGALVTYVFQGDKVRIEENGSPRVLIFDGKSTEYFEIDNEKKTWAVATLRDAQTEGEALGEQLETAYAQLPPELRQQAIAERWKRHDLWKKVLEDTWFERIASHGVEAGQACDGYLEHVAGKVVAEGCYIPWSRKTIRKEDLGAVTRLAEFLNAALAHVESAAAIDLRDGPLGRLTRAPGFPARRYDIAPDGKSGVQMRILEFVRTPSVPPETFRPPAGYIELDRPAAIGPLIKRVRERAPVQP